MFIAISNNGRDVLCSLVDYFINHFSVNWFNCTMLVSGVILFTVEALCSIVLVMTILGFVLLIELVVTTAGYNPTKLKCTHK